VVVVRPRHAGSAADHANTGSRGAVASEEEKIAAKVEKDEVAWIKGRQGFSAESLVTM
jgi:hypothetical protein